jgi:(E)-4-hydroxy-3-methylbut-2-enyl-diphosphate synthase
MGCEVNGPGEAATADVGIACGKGFGWIFRNGTMERKVPEARLVSELLKEIKKLTEK